MTKTDRTVAVSLAFGMDHVVEVRDLPVGIGDQREVQGVPGDVRGCPLPAIVLVERVDAEADHPGVALLELTA